MGEKAFRKEEIVLGALFAFQMAASFVLQRIYAAVAGYETLVMFIALAVVCIMLTMADKTGLVKKDAVTLICIIAAVITPLNLLLLHSGMGAALVIYDLVLSCLLVIRGEYLSGRMKRVICFFGAAFMLLWYPVVRWDYGFNMAGLAFIILLIFGELLMEYVKNDLDMEYLKYIQVLLFIASVLCAVCYQARSAALSMMVFAVCYFISPVIFNNRAIYNAWVSLLTLGSLIFTGLYSLLGTTGWNLRLLYKDVLSGRELIWGELWSEFLKRPLTGIGSSYEMKSFFIFEVHNGVFDILVVHGLIVFICVMILLFMALNSFNSSDLLFCPDKRLAFSGISTLLFASFFENCFIVTPYSCIFLILMLICAREGR